MSSFRRTIEASRWWPYCHSCKEENRYTRTTAHDRRQLPRPHSLPCLGSVPMRPMRTTTAYARQMEEATTTEAMTLRPLLSTKAFLTGAVQYRPRGEDNSNDSGDLRRRYVVATCEGRYVLHEISPFSALNISLSASLGRMKLDPRYVVRTSGLSAPL